MQNKHKAQKIFIGNPKERNTSENRPVREEGIIVKFALRKDDVRV